MRRLFSSQRFLAIYSGVLTLIFAASLTSMKASAGAPQTFDQITVHRINVVEPDGTLRLVISDKAELPGIIEHGQEFPHSRPVAGMLFYNDEQSENGGLTFSGSLVNGVPTNLGGLSFDQYDQDETISMDTSQVGDQRQHVFFAADEPDWDIRDLLNLEQSISNLPPDQQQKIIQQFLDSHPKPQFRMILGRSTDKSVGLRLKDTNGQDRIVANVAPDGTPVLQFLDANGKVIKQLP